MSARVLVVGAGFAGACYARVLAEAGVQVVVIDARDHVGGNAYDFTDENGIRRHRYGPHLFHTNNRRVVDWLSRFGAWTPYEHRVRARLSDDRHVPLPVNLETINTVFSTRLDTPEQVRAHLERIAIKNDQPRNGAEYLYSQIGVTLTDLFFRPYTRKMWALELEQLHAAVVKRVPIRFDHEDRYFPDDLYQQMPTHGYTALFENIFDHERITIQLGQRFEPPMEREFHHVFNSMPIDEYYGYDFGELPYRSIRFHHRSDEARQMVGWATTNYTDAGPMTRHTVWHLIPNHLVRDSGRYTVTQEEPCDYRDNHMERYYPVKTADGRYDEAYARYKARAEASARVTFIGRCGTYQYLDMHQVINQSLAGAQAWLTQRGIGGRAW